MQTTKLQKALTILIISAFAAGIGCGEGKRSKRNRVDRAGADKAAATPGAATDLKADGTDTKGTTPATTLPDQGEGTGAGGAGSAAAEQEKKDATINARLNDLKDGIGLNTTDLEAGSYAFESSATEIQIRPGNGSWIRAFVENTLSNGAFVIASQEQYGMLPDNVESENGYNVLIPASFNVENRAEQPTGTTVKYVLSSKFGDLEKSLTKQGLTDSIADAGVTAPTVALSDLVAGKNTDITGKKVTLNAWKTADGSKVRFMLSVDEIPSDTASETKPSQTRNIILSFTFKPKAVEVSEAAPVIPPVEKIAVEVE